MEKSLAPLFHQHHSRWFVRAELGQPIGGVSDQPGITETAPLPSPEDQEKQLPQQKATLALKANVGANSQQLAHTHAHTHTLQHFLFLARKKQPRGTVPGSSSRILAKADGPVLCVPNAAVLPSILPQQSHSGQ